MPIQTEKYVRKPIIVDAIQVTRENIFEVALWCNGEIHWRVHPDGKGNEGIPNHIQVRVHSPVSERQKQAHPGDWVLYSNSGYKIYMDRAFQKTFDLEPKAELKAAWKDFKKAFAEAKENLGVDIETDSDMPPGEFAVVNPDGTKKHFRGSRAVQPDAICNVCGAGKGTHVLGEMCNNNCGGTVIANPNLEKQ